MSELKFLTKMAALSMFMLCAVLQMAAGGGGGDTSAPIMPTQRERALLFGRSQTPGIYPGYLATQRRQALPGQQLPGMQTSPQLAQQPTQPSRWNKFTQGARGQWSNVYQGAREGIRTRVASPPPKFVAESEVLPESFRERQEVEREQRKEEKDLFRMMHVSPQSSEKQRMAAARVQQAIEQAETSDLIRRQQDKKAQAEQALKRLDKEEADLKASSGRLTRFFYGPEVQQRQNKIDYLQSVLREDVFRASGLEEQAKRILQRSQGGRRLDWITLQKIQHDERVFEEQRAARMR